MKRGHRTRRMKIYMLFEISMKRNERAHSQFICIAVLFFNCAGGGGEGAEEILREHLHQPRTQGLFGCIYM